MEMKTEKQHGWQINKSKNRTRWKRKNLCGTENFHAKTNAARKSTNTHTHTHTHATVHTNFSIILLFHLFCWKGFTSRNWIFQWLGIKWLSTPRTCHFRWSFSPKWELFDRKCSQAGLYVTSYHDTLLLFTFFFLPSTSTPHTHTHTHTHAQPHKLRRRWKRKCSTSGESVMRRNY